MPRYRLKSGKLIVRTGGKKTVYRKGQIVTLDPLQAKPFLDTLEQLDPDPPAPQPKAGLKAVHVGAGKYNVVNEATGKKINDKLLTKEAAAALVEAETPEIDPELGKGPDLDVIDPPAED